MFVVATMVCAYFWASEQARVKVAVLSFAMVLVHVLADALAAGTAWPVYPWWPFDESAFTVAWSMNATDWRNVVLSLVGIGMTIGYASWKGYSPVECFSFKADDWMAGVIRGEVQSTAQFRIKLYTALVIISAAILMPLWFYLY